MVRNYAERMIKGSFVVFLFSTFGMVLGYALRIFLSRNLSIEDFGLFYAIAAFAGLLNMFKDFGFVTALAKFIPEFIVKGMKKEIRYSILFSLSVQILIGTIVAALVIIFSSQIASDYFHTSQAALPLNIVMLSFVVSITTIIFQAVFRGFGDMKYYSSIEPVRIIFTFIVAYLLINLGVLGVAYSYLLSAVIVSLFSFFVLYKKFGVFSVDNNKENISNHKIAKKLIKFSFPIFLGGFAGVTLFYFDTVALTWFRSLREVALYQVAMPTSQFIFIFITCMVPMILPIFSELSARKESKLLSSALSMIIKYCFIIIIPVALILLSFPDLIIRVLFGQTYMDAVPALQILAVGAIFYSLGTLLQTVLVAIGKPYLQAKVVYMMAFLSMLLNFLLVPFLGIIGASLAFTASCFSSLILSIYFLKKNLSSIDIPWLQIIKSFAGGFITLVIIYFFKGILVLHPYVEVFICMTIGFLFYSFFVLSARIITKSDLAFFKTNIIQIPDIVFRFVSRFVKD